MQILDGPIAFAPLYQERVWGGRALERVYGRPLPRPDGRYGESWEIADRSEAQSVVNRGPASLQGKTLNTLWTAHRRTVFGAAYETISQERFPILAKILDANDRLSIQVHPPEAQAWGLGGEAKTEMWYVVRAEPGAKLYVGLKRGVDRESFEQSLREGTAEDQVHTIEPRAGQILFIPSGRLHAIGAGLLLYEIQQNSDTTYRVFDWNRLGLDGEPRELHLEEALDCINFKDVEPGMTPARGELLADCAWFRVEHRQMAAGERRLAAPNGVFALVSVIEGEIRSGAVGFQSGDFFLVPALGTPEVRDLQAGDGPVSLLVTTLPPPAG